VSFVNSDILLDKYQCAKCGKTPENAHEVFKGCSCGHRLFRIIIKYSRVSQKEKDYISSSNKDMGFLTVRERGIGIYDINVEKLLEIGVGDVDSPVIAGNNGIFSIHLKNQKKTKK
jgi:predicted  nucleic acid-binding Zn-ribbon protein